MAAQTDGMEATPEQVASLPRWAGWTAWSYHAGGGYRCRPLTGRYGVAGGWEEDGGPVFYVTDDHRGPVDTEAHPFATYASPQAARMAAEQLEAQVA